jgi:hypothetical protein
VVSPADLIHRVREERPEHLDAIANAPARSGQVDHQGVSRDAR